MKDYQPVVAELVNQYKRTVEELLFILQGIDFSNDVKTKAALLRVNNALLLLSDDVKTLVDSSIEKTLQDSIDMTLKSLKVSDILYEDNSGLGKLNRLLLKDTKQRAKDDLLLVVQTLKRKITRAVSEAKSEHIRSRISGVNSDSARRKMLDSVYQGFVDKAGRTWKPFTYAEMVAKTHLFNTFRDAAYNFALENGIDYAVISSHGATDACSNYEGKIVKFRREAPGDYMLYEDVRDSGDIFHVHCGHVVIPIASPNDVPDDISSNTHDPYFNNTLRQAGI